MRSFGAFASHDSSTASGINARKTSARRTRLSSRDLEKLSRGLGASTRPTFDKSLSVSGNTRWLTRTVFAEEERIVMHRASGFNLAFVETEYESNQKINTSTQVTIKW